MKIIVAVSGGIDSVVLLDKLVTAGAYELIVAHVDHGIRDDSSEDEHLVRELAESYGLPYVSTSLHLGAHASEEVARDRRYEWLRETQHQYGANRIATAHHQDDVIETMIINLTRGTGWRGLCALRETDEIIRPLLRTSKAEIIAYALEKNLPWRDDSTNDNVKYLRNYVRYRYVQRMDTASRQQWITLYEKQLALRDEIEMEITKVDALLREGKGYSRYMLIMAGRSVLKEIVQRKVGIQLERSTVDQLWHFVCTARPQKRFIQGGVTFQVTTRELIVSLPDIC